MRGKAIAPVLPETKLGITPAYAGKRAVSGISIALTWDHPRLCGEKRSFRFIMDVFRGSPPPMRGKVDFVQSQAEADRITPAYAGKSATGATSSIVKKDHPRLCGEKVSMLTV